MNLREIVARRDAIRVDLRAILDQHADGNLPDEVRTRADALEAEATRLNALERTTALIDDLDRRASGGTPIASGDAGFDQLASQVRITDVIRAGMGEQDAAAGRAREVSQELARRSGRQPQGLYFDMRLSSTRRPEQRVFTTAAPSGGPGSNLIQTDVSPTMIDRLRERTIVRGLGATVLAGLVGNVSIPRLKTSATAQWVAENSPISASDPETDAVPLTPKHCGGIVEISRNMVQQPSLDVAQMVENDLALIIAVALDRVALVGGGSNEPVGLLAAASGVPYTGIAGAPTWDDIVGLPAAVDTSNALAGSLGWAMNARAVSKLRRTLRSSADSTSNFIMADALTLLGYPVASTQLVPTSGDYLVSGGFGLTSILFGDWSQLVLGFWSELDILVNPYESTAYSKGNVQIRAMATADVAIKQPLAFAALTGVDPT